MQMCRPPAQQKSFQNFQNQARGHPQHCKPVQRGHMLQQPIHPLYNKLPMCLRPHGSSWSSTIARHRVILIQRAQATAQVPSVTSVTRRAHPTFPRPKHQDRLLHHIARPSCREGLLQDDALFLPLALEPLVLELTKTLQQHALVNCWGGCWCSRYTRTQHGQSASTVIINNKVVCSISSIYTAAASSELPLAKCDLSQA